MKGVSNTRRLSELESLAIEQNSTRKTNINNEFDWTLYLKKIKLKDIIKNGDTPEKREVWVKD